MNANSSIIFGAGHQLFETHVHSPRGVFIFCIIKKKKNVPKPKAAYIPSLELSLGLILLPLSFKSTWLMTEYIEVILGSLVALIFANIQSI